MARQIVAGGLQVGWSAHVGSPPPFPRARHPSACPWVGCVIGALIQLCENIWPVGSTGGCRQTKSLMPPPLWTLEPDGDLSILGPCHNSQPLSCPQYALADMPCHCGAPGCSPRFSASWFDCNSPRVWHGSSRESRHGQILRSPQNSPHLLTPLFLFAVKECKFCHSGVSVKAWKVDC